MSCIDKSQEVEKDERALGFHDSGPSYPLFVTFDLIPTLKICNGAGVSLLPVGPNDGKKGFDAVWWRYDRRSYKTLILD